MAAGALLPLAVAMGETAPLLVRVEGRQERYLAPAEDALISRSWGRNGFRPPGPAIGPVPKPRT
jgi:hypothetical protein